MSARRSSNLWKLREVPDPDGMLGDLVEELADNSALVEATPADLIAVVRRGVESGTIEGVEHKGWLVIRVSDGGLE